MSGCRSCSECAPQTGSTPLGKAEKLDTLERSGNPRYPHVLVGQQAIYSDDQIQMIVTVVSDDCDETCDSFTLKPQYVLKDSSNGSSVKEAFTVSQTVGRERWKLCALI
jgi:hypothetical protein